MSDRIVFSCDRAEIEGLVDRSADLLPPAVEDLLYRMLDEEPVEWKSRLIETDEEPGFRRWATRVGGYLVVVLEHSLDGGGILWHVWGETPPPFSLSGRGEADSLEQVKADAVKATRALVAVFGEMPR